MHRSIPSLAAIFVATFVTAAVAQDAAAPPLVEQINGGNWLDPKEAAELRDELFYQRAIHAYMTMLPALNVIGMRDGSEAAFGAGYNVLPIWKDRMDSRTWVPTPNADVIYSMSYLDLKETGPLVVMMYPTDNAYWTKLKEFVDYEPVAAIDPELRGVLASIGIVKGQPFEPTEKQQELLQKAVETAPRMIMALRQLDRTDERNRYYEDRQWENVWAGATSEWLQDDYLDVNQRATYFQVAYSSAPAMVMRTLGAGSKYPVAYRDADGESLNGSNTYGLHLPPDPPAALFWAVTAYNITDGTMVEAPQLMPSINGFNEVASNNDGSIDLWFGPEKPANAPESNWIQTVAGRNFLVALRLYGTGVEFFDQTWKPDDVVKVN